MWTFVTFLFLLEKFFVGDNKLALDKFKKI